MFISMFTIGRLESINQCLLFVEPSHFWDDIMILKHTSLLLYLAEIQWIKQAKTRSGNTHVFPEFQEVLCGWSSYALIKGKKKSFFARKESSLLSGNVYKCQRLSGLLQQLYARLSELIGLNDHLLLLDFFVRKIATNLKCYTEVVFRCLVLLFVSGIFFILHLSYFVITEWRGHWSNLESVLGAGIWVRLLVQDIENVIGYNFFIF